MKHFLSWTDRQTNLIKDLLDDSTFYIDPMSSRNNPKLFINSYASDRVKGV